MTIDKQASTVASENRSCLLGTLHSTHGATYPILCVPLTFAGVHVRFKLMPLLFYYAA